MSTLSKTSPHADHGLSEVVSNGNTIQDEQDRLPKKRFNFWTVFGIAICSSGAWEGWTASIAQGVSGGSSVALIWGWVFVSIGMCSLAGALSEFVSLWPSAGGQYVWAANLASGTSSRVLSWYTAWISIAALWLGALSCAFGVAVQMQAYITLASTYVPLRWHVFLICIACLICWLFVNIMAVKALHYMNLIVMVIHVVGYFLVMGILIGFTADKHDASYVFTDFQKSSGWNSDVVSWSVGLLSALYAYMSIDTAIHFGEEIPEASVALPRVVILQVASNALMTFPFIVVVVLCIGNTEQVLAAPIGIMSPFTQILFNSTGKVALSIFLNCLSTTVAFVAGFDLWGAAARAIWSLARDEAIPSVFAKIDKRWKVPVMANLALVPPSLLVFSIYIWNTTAFYGIMSGVVVAFQLSYALPLAIAVFYADWWKPMPKGAFNLGGFSFITQAVALLFSTYMILFMSFPAAYPVSATTMNYTSALIGIVVVFATVLWLLYGRENYQGPADVVNGIALERNVITEA